MVLETPEGREDSDPVVIRSSLLANIRDLLRRKPD